MLLFLFLLSSCSLFSKSFRLVNFAPYLRRKCSYTPSMLILLCRLFLLAARQSMQASSALALLRRLRFSPLRNAQNFLNRLPISPSEKIPSVNFSEFKELNEFSDTESASLNSLNSLSRCALTIFGVRTAKISLCKGNKYPENAENFMCRKIA